MHIAKELERDGEKGSFVLSRQELNQIVHRVMKLFAVSVCRVLNELLPLASSDL